MLNILQLCILGSVSLAIAGCATSQQMHERLAQQQKKTASSLGANIAPEKIFISNEGVSGMTRRYWNASTNPYYCEQDSGGPIVCSPIKENPY